MNTRNYKYITKEDYYIKINDYELLYIPRFFLYDGDTGVFDTCRLASCVHDYLYGLQRGFFIYDVNRKIFLTRHFSREESDLIYRRLTNAIFKNIRYFGIRLFGGFFWNNNFNEICDYAKVDRYKQCNHDIEVYKFENKEMLRCIFEYGELAK